MTMTLARLWPRLVKPLQLAVLSIAVAGCGVDAAPEELGPVVPWFWSHYDSASDEEIASRIVQLAGAASQVDADNPVKATVGHLGAGDIADLKLSARDVTRAKGLFIVTEFKCTLSQLEKIVTDLGQDKLYEGMYDTYKRTYTTSRDDYFARKTKRLSWSTDLSATNVGTTFTEHLAGGARFVPDLGKEKSPFGAALLTRTWLTKAADSSDSDKSWDQDYQSEVYFERTPGHIVHLFVAWRHIDYGYLSTDDDSLINLMLGKFVDWDAITEQNCADGKPK